MHIHFKCASRITKECKLHYAQCTFERKLHCAQSSALCIMNFCPQCTFQKKMHYPQCTLHCEFLSPYFFAPVFLQAFLAKMYAAEVSLQIFSSIFFSRSFSANIFFQYFSPEASLQMFPSFFSPEVSLQIFSSKIFSPVTSLQSLSKLSRNAHFFHAHVTCIYLNLFTCKSMCGKNYRYVWASPGILRQDWVWRMFYICIFVIHLYI